MKRYIKILSLLLALVLLTSLAAPALAAETASVIRLTKTTGTVEISKSSGKSVSLLKNMRLYNGYHVVTSEESYAWVNLDDSKLIKEDAESEVEVRKDGKHLEVLLLDGNLLFDVAEPLENDESMNIRTSTMMVGIRGTCGWVTQDTAALLEGTVEVTAGERSVTISTGEIAVLTADGNIDVRPFRAASVPDFVRAEFEEDSALAEAVLNASGLDVLDPPTDDPIRSITYLADGTPNAQSEYTYDQQSNMTN